jgi:hypothetical protein
MILTCGLLLKKKKRSLVRNKIRKRNDHTAKKLDAHPNGHALDSWNYSSSYDFAGYSYDDGFVVYGCCYKHHSFAYVD